MYDFSMIDLDKNINILTMYINIDGTEYYIHFLKQNDHKTRYVWMDSKGGQCPPHDFRIKMYRKIGYIRHFTVLFKFHVWTPVPHGI